MSRIGRLPIAIEKGVEVKVTPTNVRVKGPKGELTLDYNPRISIKVDGDSVCVERSSETKSDRALHGTYRALLANMVSGVTNGFSKVLEIHGVGYRAQAKGSKLVLQIGKSHPVEVEMPKGIDVGVEKNTIITINGIDKQLVGAMAAKIRGYYPPEPYLGKGIRYAGEHVRRKAGKTIG